MKKDYLVYAPAYRNSAGIRAMHLLAHNLNERGYNAFVTTGVVNPDLNVIAIKDKEHMFRLWSVWKKNEPIVVYPEVIPGNPTGYSRIARYVLNKPGHLGGDSEYAETEMVFAYNKYCQSFCRPGTPILEMPIYNMDIFHNGKPCKREGGIFVVYKGANVPRVKDTETMRELSMDNPVSLEELGDIYRRADIFYSYDNNTAMVQEARLCGCPVVIIPDPALKLAKSDSVFISEHGLAWGNSPEEIHYARDTVHLFANDFSGHFANFGKQMDSFITITQKDTK